MLLVLFFHRSFDWSAFDKECSAHLPVYARPAFIRVTKKMAITSTFKHQKGDLVKEGFDPSAVHDDVVYYYSAKDHKVEKLSEETFEAIQSGKIQL